MIYIYFFKATDVNFKMYSGVTAFQDSFWENRSQGFENPPSVLPSTPAPALRGTAWGSQERQAPKNRRGPRVTRAKPHAEHDPLVTELEEPGRPKAGHTGKALSRACLQADRGSWRRWGCSRVSRWVRGMRRQDPPGCGLGHGADSAARKPLQDSGGTKVPQEAG